MRRRIECPFCGEWGERSREHVWAQWLRRTAGAQALLQGTHGERLDVVQHSFGWDNDERFIATPRVTGKTAALLPHVQVSVCKTCNTGWMSSLEQGAKDLLGPYIFEGQLLRLSSDDLERLAAWATKGWMAYSLNDGPLENPFTESDYRTISRELVPPDRCRIWMASSHHAKAQVALGRQWALLSANPEAVATSKNNVGFAYLAAGTVVFFMLLVPSGFPEDLTDSLASLGYPVLGSPHVRQIWPKPKKQFFPLQDLEHWELEHLLDVPETFKERLSLPSLGLTAAEHADAYRRFLSGANPMDLGNSIEL